MSEVLTEECPFCKHNVIRVMHTEETFSTRRTRIRSGRSTQYIKNPEKNEVLSNECPNCGKSKKEIERALKHGKESSNADIAKRLKEAGLDPTKLK